MNRGRLVSTSSILYAEPHESRGFLPIAHLEAAKFDSFNLSALAILD